MKKRNLLLAVSLFCLTLAGCGNEKSSKEAELESIIESMSAERERESMLNSMLNSVLAESQNKSEVVEPSTIPSDISSVEPSSEPSSNPIVENLVDMNRVMNLQSSSQGKDDARLGSWFCAWEGWPVDIKYTNEILSVTQPADCFYSGSASWYVQINIPYDNFKIGESYCLSFDIKGKSTKSSDPTVGAPQYSSPIDIQFLDATIDSPDLRGETAKVIGTIPADSFDSFTHFEYKFANSLVASKG